MKDRTNGRKTPGSTTGVPSDRRVCCRTNVRRMDESGKVVRRSAISVTYVRFRRTMSHDLSSRSASKAHVRSRVAAAADGEPFVYRVS